MSDNADNSWQTFRKYATIRMSFLAGRDIRAMYHPQERLHALENRACTLYLARKNTRDMNVPIKREQTKACFQYAEREEGHRIKNK